MIDMFRTRATVARSFAPLALASVAVVALLAWPMSARAEVERFALIVGNNVGDSDEVELRYAEDDANKLYNVLRNLGGFAPENMLLLRGDTAATVRQSLISMNHRIRQRAGPGQSTMLFVYYSGHADARQLHLDGTQLGMREIEQLVAGSAASFRVLVLDSCRSGALTRVKGGRVIPRTRLRVNDQLAGEGTVFLTASAANEDAQESDEIKGSFFTHYLVSGLLGAADRNNDGNVVLQEAYRHAYEHTLRASSRTLAGVQHPTFRYDMRGQGQVVLTRVTPERRRAIIHLPPDRSYLIFRGGPDGPVIAEVGKRDGVRRISVKAGRYFVRGRASRYLLEGTVQLAGGQERTIDDGELRRIDYARFVRKGLGEVRAVHGPRAGFRARAGVFRAGACMGPYTGYALETRHLTLTGQVHSCRATLSGEDSREIGVEVRLVREWDLRWVTLGAGLTPGLALLDDSADVSDTPVGDFRVIGVLGSVVSATVELRGSAYATLDVAAQTYIQNKRTQIFDAGASPRDPPKEIHDELDASVVATLGLGIGVRW